MATILETPNPFEPYAIRRHAVQVGTTLRQWVCQQFPQTGEFPVPTICLLNGKPVLREGWNYEVQKKDVVHFLAVPGDPFTIIAIIIAVVAIAFALLMPLPPIPGTGPESDPVFSTKGKFNTIRLGEPVEVCYGRNRLYPSLAARPYYRYENNDQFQFALLCLGQGSYEISSILIGDTAIDSFEEIQYEVIPPGSSPSLFATNVYTSAEAGGQTLFGPNEPEYPADGWVGPFTTNPSGTTTKKIEIDLVFPKGIYGMNSDGVLTSQTVVVSGEVRLIDDMGAPLGAWFPPFSPATITVTASTTTPLRRTFIAEMAEGRYEIRLRRTNDKPLDYQYGADVVWEGLRAWIEMEEEHDYGDVTLLAVKVRATNNLNERTQQQFNVLLTRKLPVYESGGWSEPQVTRSIVWAFVDLFKSLYGGRITDDVFLDMDTLIELDALFESRGEYFDWIMRDSTTLWEAARMIAMVGRAVPLVVGSLITMKRDAPQDLPVAMFNPENIAQGSFQWDIKLWNLVENDSLEVEYTDPSTGYLQEQVVAVLPGGTSDNPLSVRIPGIQDRTHAYRAGLYLMACKQYLRENVTFETGQEGYIPSYGDLIAVSHDVPEWGKAGYVVDVVKGDADFYNLFLSEPVSFEESSNYQILLRGRKGEIIGPVTANETDDPQQVMVQMEGEIDFLLDGTTEPMLFLFGVENQVTKYLKVVRLEPQGGERVRITAVNDAPIVHSFDSLTPPPLGQNPYPPFAPDLPVVTVMYVTQLSTSLNVVQVAWLAAFGAQYYIVQSSEDGENWQIRATTPRTSAQFQVQPGDLWVRVAAVNNGQGPWLEKQVVVEVLPGLGLAVLWDNGLEWTIQWNEVLNALGYRVQVFDNSESEPVLKHTEDITSGARTFNYDLTDATGDGNVVREMLVEVDPLFNDGTGGTAPSGSPASLALSNDIPSAPTGLASEISSEESDQIVYHLSWTLPEHADLDRLKVWVSEVSGFDPEVEVPIVDETAVPPGYENLPVEAFVNVALDSGGEHSTLYWRIAIFDVWGNEYAANVSAEQVIAAYP